MQVEKNKVVQCLRTAGELKVEVGHKLHKVAKEFHCLGVSDRGCRMWQGNKDKIWCNIFSGWLMKL